MIDDDLKQNPNIIIPYIREDKDSAFALQVKKMRKPKDKKQSMIQMNETQLSFGKLEEVNKGTKAGHKRTRTQTTIMKQSGDSTSLTIKEQLSSQVETPKGVSAAFVAPNE